MRATIAVTSPSQRNAPNPLQAEFSTNTFFMVLIEEKRNVTKVLAHQLQVEPFAFEVFLPHRNRTLDDIEVSGGVAMLDSGLLGLAL